MINGHPTLLTQAKTKGIDVGVAPLPGLVGPSQRHAGRRRLDDGVQAERPPGRGRQVPAVRLQRQELAQVPRRVRSAAGDHQRLADDAEGPEGQGLRALPQRAARAVFYPVNKISWGPVSDQVKKTIGKAVHGDPKRCSPTSQRFGPR